MSGAVVRFQLPRGQRALWGGEMQSRLTSIRFGFLATVVVLLGAGPIEPASANDLCSGPRLNFVGAVRAPLAGDPGENVRGAYSVTRDRFAEVCASLNLLDGDSSLWTMVASGGSLQGYAQAGYGVDWRGGNPVAFTEYNDGACTDLTPANCVSPHWVRKTYSGIWTVAGGTHRYTVKQIYSASAGHYVMQMFIDGQLKDQTTWNPEDVWQTPWEAQWAAETHDLGDDIPGSEASPADVGALLVSFGINQFQDADQTKLLYPPNPQPGIYYQDFPPLASCYLTCFRVWTDRPPFSAGH